MNAGLAHLLLTVEATLDRRATTRIIIGRFILAGIIALMAALALAVAA